MSNLANLRRADEFCAKTACKANEISAQGNALGKYLERMAPYRGKSSMIQTLMPFPTHNRDAINAQ